MTNEVTSTEMPANAPQPSGIQISDLQSILNIIDLASTRGAFKAAELTAVGSVADKISTFLSVIAKQQKEKADAEASAKSQESPAETKAEATTEATATAEATAEATTDASTKE
jgi:hypothetical protein